MQNTFSICVRFFFQLHEKFGQSTTILLDLGLKVYSEQYLKRAQLLRYFEGLDNYMYNVYPGWDGLSANNNPDIVDREMVV